MATLGQATSRSESLDFSGVLLFRAKGTYTDWRIIYKATKEESLLIISYNVFIVN